MATHTFTNGHTNETITTSLTAQEVLDTFRETAGEGNWLWYWLVKHAEQAKKAPAQTAACKDMIAFIGDSFLLALGMGLKKPMIRLHFGGKRFKVYLSARGTICFKTGDLIPGTNDPTGDEEYMGCLYQGRFLVAKINGRERKLSQVEQECLDNLSKDPAGFLAKCSKDMCRCCYCYKPLEDQRSKDVGYGKVCADHWGLPWGKTYDEKVPSFSDLWSKGQPEDKASIRGICLSIRQAPRDEFLWTMLGDALSDLGFPKRPTMPEGKVVIPSA